MIMLVLPQEEALHQDLVAAIQEVHPRVRVVVLVADHPGVVEQEADGSKL